MFYLAIFLIVYGIAVYLITAFKPKKIWNMGKIQGFVKIMGSAGTQVFFYVFGGASLGIGIWLLIKYWPAA